MENLGADVVFECKIKLQVDIELDLPEVVNMPSLESILNEVC